VIRQQFDKGHSVYELAQGDHHDHMICIESGKIIEFQDEEIEQRQRLFAESCGYDLQEHSLILYVKPIVS
jgi:Fur family ferric uptake transcriptional regulator